MGEDYLRLVEIQYYTKENLRSIWMLLVGGSDSQLRLLLLDPFYDFITLGMLYLVPSYLTTAPIFLEGIEDIIIGNTS